MGDPQRSPTLDLHNFFKIAKNKSLKDVGKAYKSLVTKRHQSKDKTTEEPTTSPTFEHNDNQKRVDENIWVRPKLFSRTTSRRSKTPNPRSRPLSRHGSRRCTTPTSLSRNATEIATSSLKRIMSRRGTSSSSSSQTQSESPSSSSPSLSRNMSRRGSSEAERLNPAASPSMDVGTERIPAVSLSSNLSRRASTPIIFSQTTARKKPPEVEKKLECTLEDLCFGCIKRIKVRRDVIKHPGVILQEEEVLKIEVKPGWRKGTKITFEGKADERPGYLPADIVFLIDEKKHSWFRRSDGNNLEICFEIPLVDALTGCSIAIPLLGGEEMTVSFENMVIYPGYEKVINGQGMPNPKNDGTRGDLQVKFLIKFPTELSDEQREEAFGILQDCC